MDFDIGKRYFSSNKIIILPIILFATGGSFLFVLTKFLLEILSSWKELIEELNDVGTEQALVILISFLFFILLALSLIVIGILIIVSKAKHSISNETYEKSIKAYPENIVLRARTTLNFPEDEKLLVPAMQFEDYKYHNVSAVKHSNGRVRTDLYEKSVVLLTEKYLYCYSLRFRTTKQEEVVNTEMLSYQDIISITLTQKSDTLRRESICIKHLEITTVGGNVIKLPYRYDEQAQRDVNIIRQILREKKSTTERYNLC